MQGRILVTGFEPFGDHLTNISGEIADSLAGETIRGCVIESLVLPVDESGSKVVSGLLSDNKFSAIMHLGLAENSVRPRIEMRAKDVLDFRVPDNSGRQVRNSKITGMGDLFSTIVIDDWDIANMIDSPVASNDAGEYLCN